jgi:hypothetical protein
VNAKLLPPDFAVTFYRGRNASNLLFLAFSETLENVGIWSFQSCVDYYGDLLIREELLEWVYFVLSSLAIIFATSIFFSIPLSAILWRACLCCSFMFLKGLSLLYVKIFKRGICPFKVHHTLLLCLTLTNWSSSTQPASILYLQTQEGRDRQHLNREQVLC